MHYEKLVKTCYILCQICLNLTKELLCIVVVVFQPILAQAKVDPCIVQLGLSNSQTKVNQKLNFILIQVRSDLKVRSFRRVLRCPNKVCLQEGHTLRGCPLRTEVSGCYASLESALSKFIQEILLSGKTGVHYMNIMICLNF